MSQKLQWQIKTPDDRTTSMPEISKRPANVFTAVCRRVLGSWFDENEGEPSRLARREDGIIDADKAAFLSHDVDEILS